jgi:hypothetical protein
MVWMIGAGVLVAIYLSAAAIICAAADSAGSGDW